MKLFLLVLKNLRRSPLRTILTSLGTMVLVFVVTLVWSVLFFLDKVTADKSENFKAIVTERWQIPSQMPMAYAASLSEGAARTSQELRPTDSMTWQFFGGTIDPGKRTQENMVFAFALEPKKLTTMMDDLDEGSLTATDFADMQANVKKLEQNRQGIIIGTERLEKINKRVGERIKLYGLNYKEINLEFEIVGAFPNGRYNQSAAFNRQYLNDSLDEYERAHNGQKHPMAMKTLNLVWLRVPSKDDFAIISSQIMNSPLYSSPAVKCETASSGVAAFLDAYRDLLWGMRWLLSPAILVTLSLVIANAISISVRERRSEMAVLKVLGFQPWQILTLVLSEAMVVGVASGAISATATYFVINNVIGGIKMPIAFFPAFFIPPDGIVWGIATGAITAFIGSAVPAWGARTVKVSEVFSKVA